MVFKKTVSSHTDVVGEATEILQSVPVVVVLDDILYSSVAVLIAKPSVSSVEKATHIKDARIEKKSNLNVLTVKDHVLQITKGVQPTKNRCSDNMWWTIKKATPLF